MLNYKLEEHNEYSIRDAKVDKAILAIGSTESHGGHLPFGCDTFISYKLACEVASRLENTVVVPPLWFGMSQHYSHKPMNITLSNDTLIRVLKEILASLAHWGINKVLIINGHDGNIAPIEIATRDIKLENPDFNLAILDAWWATAGNLLPPGTFEVWNGMGHGGEGETSIALAMFPELCHIDQAKGMIKEMDPNVKLVWNYQDLTDHGSNGDPSKGTVEKGNKMKKVLVDYLVAFVKRMDDQGWRYI